MKYIEESDGFYVCSNGDIFRKGKKLKPHSGGANDKYLKQRIYNIDGSSYRENIHRIVAKYFLPNPENLPVVNHKNGVKKDNRVENLEWCTVADNNRHAFKTGLNNSRLENHHQACLTNEQVHQICKLMQDGWRNCDISKLYGISKSIPTSIRNGITWTEISSQYDLKRQRVSRISEETVRWICQMLSNGESIRGILEKATNDKIAYHIIVDIKNRRRWCTISKEYIF